MGTINLPDYSGENLEKINKFVKLVISHAELDGLLPLDSRPRLRMSWVVKLPFQMLEREGFVYEEAKKIVKTINQINGERVVEILNDVVYHPIKNKLKTLEIELHFGADSSIAKWAIEHEKKKALNSWLLQEGGWLGISENDIKNQLILRFVNGQPSLASLLTVQKAIDEKLEQIRKKLPLQDKNSLQSIHLIADSLEPKSVIFLVLDEQFEMPTRCAVYNNRGKITYIKKLYDIAYIVNAPNKKVFYNKVLADNINNGLFRKRAVAKYMKINKLKKPTLVQKSEDGKSLVLKNEVPVKTGLIKHDVPPQHQSLYIDKTK